MIRDKEVKSNSDIYEIYLGTFIDNAFTWYSISKHKDPTEAYKEFKKYVNTQLKYTDEELKQVWDTGRLDIELRQGNKLLNWVGIYSREVKPLSEKEEKEAEKAEIKTEEKKDSVSDAIDNFSLANRLVMTRAVASEIKSNKDFNIFVHECIEKFANGDWGSLDESDKLANMEAVKDHSDIILGNYEYPADPDLRIYIITDVGGEVTTILFPEEY